MARYSDTLTDSRGRSLAGAFVTVAASDSGALASLTYDDASPQPNPLITNDDGSYYFNVAGGLYNLTYNYGGRTVLERDNLSVGAGVVGPVSSATIIAALGYTPYNAANPQGYVSTAGARAAFSAGTGLAFNSSSGQYSTSLALLSPLFGGAPLVKTGGTVTGPILATYSTTDPTALATQGYVQSIASGQLPKANSDAATTGNITLSGTQTVDGVALTAGQLVLVKNQTLPAQNGIYNVAAGAWARSTEMDTWAEVPGASTFILGGTVNANTGWACNSSPGGTINTTPINFVQTSASGTLTASGAITKTGSNLTLTPIANNNILGNVSGSTASPTALTAGQVKTALALDQVDNTSDANKPVSTAQAAALAAKVATSTLATASGASLTGVRQQGAGAGLRTMYARVREDMRVTDFYDGVSDPNHPFARGTSGFNNAFDDTPYFNAATDACRALGETRLRIPRSFYRVACDGTGWNIRAPVHIMGDSHLESGQYPGLANNGTGWGEQSSGTIFKVNSTSTSRITHEAGNSRGVIWEGIVVVQDHPAVTSGWAPNDYDYVFDTTAAGGRVEFRNITLAGVTRGIKGAGRLTVGQINSQTFKNLLLIDNAQDTVLIGRIHEYPFWDTSVDVANYTQANRDLITIGRCDGLHADYIFGICGLSTIKVIDTGLGPCADFHVNTMYSDLTKYGLYVTAPGFRGRFDFFKAQCEKIGTGIGIAGSSGIYFNGATGSRLDVGTFRAERYENTGIRNISNASISIDRHSYFSLTATPLWQSSTTPIILGSREFYSGGTTAGSEADVSRTITNKDSAFPGEYASDALAGSAGIGIGGSYRNSDGLVHWRRP